MDYGPPPSDDLRDAARPPHRGRARAPHPVDRAPPPPPPPRREPPARPRPTAVPEARRAPRSAPREAPPPGADPSTPPARPKPAPEARTPTPAGGVRSPLQGSRTIAYQG